MEKIEIAKVLFGQYYDCRKITKTDDGIITDEQRAISENNFIELMHSFFSAMEKNVDASENTLPIHDVIIAVCGDTTFPCKYRKGENCYNSDECSLKM